MPCWANRETAMQQSDYVALAFATFILAAMFTLSPNVKATPNSLASLTRNIGLPGLGRNVPASYEEDFPSH